MEKKNIKKIMSRESAQKEISDFKLKICGVDLDEICSDEELVEKAKSPQEEKIQKTLENAVMCGLVKWNENKKCLEHHLIKPLKSGEQTCDVLFYENELSLNKAKGNSAKDQVEALIAVISLVTGKSKPLIGQLAGVDVDIATACINFFDL
ncbi:hypothetical protein IJX73_02930 [bacterium]|nr:hypothetical protein [bacterium]